MLLLIIHNSFDVKSKKQRHKTSYENINIICRMYDIIFLIVNIIFFIISLSLTSFDEALNGKGDNYYFLCAKFVLGKHDKRRRGGGGGKHRMN